jgi:hypothetical protein
MTTTTAPVTVQQRESLAKYGNRAAVAEFHPEMHAEFRAAWPTMTESEASEWIRKLILLPPADGDFCHVGLRQCLANGWDPEFATMHPAQAAILAKIPAEDRGVVCSSARLQQNMCGGNFSGNLSSAAAQYRRIGAAAMARQDRFTNARAMGWQVDQDGHRIDR